MSEAPPAFRGERIRELNRLLEQDPDAVEARFERAGLLREQGAFEAAKRDYLEVLRQRPTDFAALNDFGALVLKAGFRGAARTLFSAAVEHHRDDPKGHVNLANLLLLTGELDQARMHFEAALRIDPDHIHAHRGMSNLLAETGDEAGARRHRDKGFRNHPLTTLPYRGEQPPVSVLLLVSAVGGNTPTETFLDDRYFHTTVLAAEYYDPKLPLPPHDVVFNSIGDADLCREGLEAACSIVARTGRPVINHPQAVRKTGRVANAERLRGLPDIIVPRMMTLPRSALADAGGVEVVAGNGFSFPLLVRAPGFHTGRHFVRVETPERLAAAIAELPGEDVWLIEHLDARDNEGTFRKFRVMIIDGQLYPLHLAISRDWKVHYFTADMAHSAENCSKDAAFLENMTERRRAARHRSACAYRQGARPRLWRYRLRRERAGRDSVLRSQRHHGRGPPLARREVGLSPAGCRSSIRGRAHDARGTIDREQRGGRARVLGQACSVAPVGLEASAVRGIRWMDRAQHCRRLHIF